MVAPIFLRCVSCLRLPRGHSRIRHGDGICWGEGARKGTAFLSFSNLTSSRAVSSNGTPAATATPSGAPITVRPGDDLRTAERIERRNLPQRRHIGRAWCLCPFGANGHVKLLVEVAVEQRPVPPDRHVVKAHQPFDRTNVVRVDQQLHVISKLALLGEVVCETLHRQVSDAEKGIETDPEHLLQFLLVGSLELRLGAGEEGTSGIVHEVKVQTRAFDPVADGVKLLERGDALVEDALATLRVNVVHTVARHRGHHLHTILCQERRSVLLVWLVQHREIAPVDNFDTALPHLLHQVFEVFVHLGSPAGDVHGVHRFAGCIDQLDHPVHCGPVHVFEHTCWSRFDVAVMARLVAEETNVDLHSTRVLPNERIVPVFRQFVFEVSQPLHRRRQNTIAARLEALLPLPEALEDVLALLRIQLSRRRRKTAAEEGAGNNTTRPHTYIRPFHLRT
eukprot:Hpha_TRINITY_DN16194_c7_g19::TRINITY_DN16194_c7_g19_i1::g.7238::m.7238